MLSRTAVLISEDEELYQSFKRALKALRKMTVLKFKKDSLKNKNSVILISTSEDKIHELFYERIRSKYLNPVVVIGCKEKESFEKEFPIFYDHPFNHAYIRIPFNLMKFIDLLKKMIPISSQAIRRAICGSNTGYKGYLLKLLSHELLKDRGRCVDILRMVENYLMDKELSGEIEKAVKNINKNKKDWFLIAPKIGKMLEDSIKKGES